MFRLRPLILLLLAFSFAMTGIFSLTQATYALRRPFVGGYGIALKDTYTFAYYNFYSEVTGEVKAGDIVYIRGWDTAVYNIDHNKWVAQGSIKVIIDWQGNPIVPSVTRSGNQYYLDGEPITLPPAPLTEVEKFLANPDVDAPLIYNGRSVAPDVAVELVDTSAVWYGSGDDFVARMRVTDLYDKIYLYTAPSFEAPKALMRAEAATIFMVTEIVDENWYRIGENLWAPRLSSGEELLVEEDVESYAPDEYYEKEKWMSIDLNRQQLTAWEGTEVVASTPIRSGRYGYETPVGVFRTYEKVPNEHMAGSDYDLLDVAWTQYFTPDRMAIHVGYWHNDYNGRPGSHGCVNIQADIGKALYMWAPLSTTIVTHNPYQFDAIDIANAGKASD